MESIVRGAVVYIIVLVVFRINGKRSLAQITTFDFVLLLIIAEAIQQALIDVDYSMTNAFLIVLTLLGLDVGFSLIKQRSERFQRLIDDVPLVLVADGRPLPERMAKARVDDSDILASARQLQGLERMDQIKYAVLERSGGISIVPKRAG
ncbi:MAG TPA: YetF domain-containing protein [Thermomicrobiales bacterium]|nr:YetF domain-containing protein [Thermomicrobiales bacterium]